MAILECGRASDHGWRSQLSSRAGGEVAGGGRWANTLAHLTSAEPVTVARWYLWVPSYGGGAHLRSPGWSQATRPSPVLGPVGCKNLRLPIGRRRVTLIEEPVEDEFVEWVGVWRRWRPRAYLALLPGTSTRSATGRLGLSLTRLHRVGNRRAAARTRHPPSADEASGDDDGRSAVLGGGEPPPAPLTLALVYHHADHVAPLAWAFGRQTMDALTSCRSAADSSRRSDSRSGSKVLREC